MTSTQTEAPWYAAYPVAKSDPPGILRAELLQWFKDGKEAGKDFALVDLRRTDYEVCANLGFERRKTHHSRAVRFEGQSTFLPKASIQQFQHCTIFSNQPMFQK
jgi:hypothetical protein